MSDCEQCKGFYLELERLRLLAPTGTYTLTLAHEEELERMREALRAAEKRELEALAELDEERENVRTLKTHVETLREAWRSASDEVTRLRWGEEMACENTPNPACECPGCETARDRAVRGETQP